MPVAFNPKTGEALALSPDGSWVPAQIATNPQTGKRLAMTPSGDWEALDVPEPSFLGRAGKFADNVVRQVANGATFGLADEAAAAVDSFTGRQPGTYDERLKAERAHDAEFEKAHPFVAGGAQIGGGIMGTLAGARALAPAVAAIPRAAEAISAFRSLPTVAQGAIAGGAAGGAQGFGQGEGGIGPRARNAAMGAAIGVPTGIMAPWAIGGLQNLARPALERFRAPESLAPTKLAKALERDGISSEQFAHQLAGLGPEAALVDAGGTNVRALGGAVANIPGPGKQTAESFLTERRGGQGARLASEVERAFGSSGDIYGETAARAGQRRAQAAPLYERAYQATPVLTEQQTALLGRPSIKSAMQKAYRIAGEEGRDPNALGFTFNDAGDVVFTGQPSIQTLDYVKRGMDDVLEGYRDKTTGRLVLDDEGRSINNTRTELLKALDESNPDYKAARQAWAGPSQEMDAIHTGRAFMRRDPEITEQALQSLPKGAQDSFRIGAARQVLDTINQNTDNAARRMGENKGLLWQRLDAVLPSDKAAGLRSAVGRENVFDQTGRAILGGSPTQPRLAAAADLAQPNLLTGAIDLGADVATGNKIGLMRRIAKALGDDNAPGERTAGPLAQMLFTADPEVQRRALAALASNPTPIANNTGLQMRIAAALAQGIAPSGP